MARMTHRHVQKRHVIFGTIMKFLKLSILALSLGIFMASCGGGETTTTEEASATTTTVTETAPPPAAPADTAVAGPAKPADSAAAPAAAPATK